MAALIDPASASRPGPLPEVEDFVLAQEVDPRGEEYRVLPAEGPSREELERVMSVTPVVPVSWVTDDEASESRSWRLQFSLGELLLVFTMLGIGLAAATWLPIEGFAGAMGIVTLLCLLAFWIRPPQTRFAYLFWGTVVALYLSAATTAVVRSFW